MEKEMSVAEEISLLKGIHPGVILDKKLKERKLSKKAFATLIGEYPQTLGAITKRKRNMNTALSLKIEHALGLEEGYFMTLQVFYEIKELKRERHAKFKPDLSKLRTILFWDTDIDTIDWIQMKPAVIQRVNERGNEDEINEITHFYEREDVVNEP